MLVFRTNVALGIPDSIFCLGESAILSIVGWICTMPIIVLASRLCPEGMEGTTYALIMSINNLGGIVGSQLGAVLTTALGVTETNMQNFWLLVFICNISTVLPLVSERGRYVPTRHGLWPSRGLQQASATLDTVKGHLRGLG